MNSDKRRMKRIILLVGLLIIVFSSCIYVISGIIGNRKNTENRRIIPIPEEISSISFNLDDFRGQEKWYEGISGNIPEKEWGHFLKLFKNLKVEKLNDPDKPNIIIAIAYYTHGYIKLNQKDGSVTDIELYGNPDNAHFQPKGRIPINIDGTTYHSATSEEFYKFFYPRIKNRTDCEIEKEEKIRSRDEFLKDYIPQLQDWIKNLESKLKEIDNPEEREASLERIEEIRNKLQEVKKEYEEMKQKKL